MEDITVSNDSLIKFIKPVHIEWKPNEDITVYELAQCMPLLMTMARTHIMPYMYNLSNNWMRHFKIDDPNSRYVLPAL